MPARVREAETTLLRFGPADGVPNHPDLPVLVTCGAVAGTPEEIEALMRRQGWGGTWTWSVYDFHHFHPDGHEALVVARGGAELQLGRPGGKTLRVGPGDALVLPAGTGHRRVSASEGFAVCGAYPPGQDGVRVVRAGEMDPAEAARQIAALALPETDPVFGAEGPVVRHWGAGRAVG